MKKNEAAVLRRTTPEEQGIASNAIADFVGEIEAKGLELHSFMLLRRGEVVAEGWWAPYAADLPHMLFSLSKSFTSTAIGFAVTEGLLSLDDRVVSFFPEDLPAEVSPNLAAMEVRHLLMMGTGHAEDTMSRLGVDGSDNWVRAILAQPVDYAPGTHFVYNSGATYMLSAIVQKASGQKLLDFLKPRLLEPLGITGASWESCPRGIHTGGWGLSVTTEDIAKFGQFYLQKGLWNGQRLLPEQWVDEATSKHISNGDGGESDWTQGYGFQFWRCRHGAYRGDGAFGQYCVVMPEQEAVLAITSGLGDMQAVLDLVWKHLLPAFGPSRLPADSASTAALGERLGHLKLVPPSVLAHSPMEQAISGREYRMEENETHLQMFGIRFEEEQAVASFIHPQGRTEVRFGREAWTEGTARLLRGSDDRMMGSFTWQSPEVLELTVRYTETPFYCTYICRFQDGITIETKLNVSFGPNEWVKIKGSAASEVETI